MNNYFLKGLLLLLATCFSIASLARVIYVDQSAAVLGDGSFTSPFKTIQEATDLAVAGDTVMIRAGTYREQVIVKSDGVTFMAYNQEKANINGTEALLDWQAVSGSVYKSRMNWNVTEGGQSNQVFLDGNMMHLARWPQNTADLVLPTNAYSDDIAFDGDNTVIYDADFKEYAGRWDGSEIWINLSRSKDGTGWDGQGWTGKVLSTFPGRIVVSGKISGRIGDEPWGMGPNQEYYLFNPYEPAVAASGGIASYLKPNEWWKNGDTLFVRMPAENPPANAIGQNNLIEAKKRVWGISPEPSKITFANTSVIGLNLFATSIISDLYANTRLSQATSANGNIIDGIHALYVTHFTNQAGDYQVQWDSRSGIILSGINSVIKNCTIRYSAAAAICVMGKNNKVLNNTLYDCNYNSTETGVLNTGGRGLFGRDEEIAYNTIYNTPQQAISIEQNSNSERSVPARARVHHNVIHDFMLKTHDSGAVDIFGIAGNWARWDHNIIYNSNNFLSIGMYCDFGKDVIIDHNLMWNIDRPIQINYRSDLINGPVLIFNNTALADKTGKPGIQNGVGNFGKDFNVQNNITTSALTEADGGPWVLSNINLNTEADYSSFFTDYQNMDYTLKAGFTAAVNTGEYLPFSDAISGNRTDLGCYESGIPAWKAGAGNLKPEFAISDSAFFLRTGYGVKATWTFPVQVLPYCGFKGTVSLSPGEIPNGITVELPVATIEPNQSFMLTISVDSLLNVGKYPVMLTATSGELTNTRIYVIEVPQKLTSIKITSRDSVLILGQSLQMKAAAYDQQKNVLRVQPTFGWSAVGGGQMTSKGKYTANKIADTVLIIAKVLLLKDTLVIKVIDQGSGIGESRENSANLKVYPNPAQDHIFLDYYSPGNSDGQILIFDNLMRVVGTSLHPLVRGQNIFTINLSGLQAGVYFVSVQADKERLVKTILIR